MKYTLWIDYGSEGWHPFDYDSIADCLECLTYSSGQGYRITREVVLVEHEPVPAAPAPAEWKGAN